MSQIALPRLWSEGQEFDLALVDGDHRYDSVFVDPYFLNKLVNTDGLIVADDLRLPAVRTAVEFFVSNLNWQYVDAPFPGGTYRPGNESGRIAVMRRPRSIDLVRGTTSYRSGSHSLAILHNVFRLAIHHGLIKSTLPVAIPYSLDDNV